ncbi:hypothetical protein BJY01DRAFT_258443 [Aspergillus pseudoustus]|uniref:NAD(P)-binding domain-containing protein n=1 Tax=Aspergillus pseudoustus TaxID=1810923 RepID=A0ABR4JB08_9EURO
MHALIFGGNGRIARAMTRLLLARAWTVTSIIRNPQQGPGILALGRGQPGDIHVLQYDLRDLKTAQDAETLFNRTGATCAVFAAGSFSNPYAIDRDAAKAAIAAATSLPSVTKFLMISFPASRRKPAPWWNSRDIADYTSERAAYPDIGDAKIQADEYLVAMANPRRARGGGGQHAHAHAHGPPFQAISLRPTWLTTGRATGRVSIGETRALGQVSIEDVAAVAVEMLGREDVSGWFDLVAGDVEIQEAVDSVVQGAVDCIEGEDVEAIYKLAD